MSIVYRRENYRVVPVVLTSKYVMGSSFAASFRCDHVSTHNPANGQYNAISAGLYVDIPAGLEPRQVYGQWNTNAPHSGLHIHSVMFGVYDKSADIWLTPIIPTYQTSTNIAIPGQATSTIFGGSGSGNGQYLQTPDYFYSVIVVPQEFLNLLTSSDRVLRFFMFLRNADTNPLGNWRAYFGVFCV